MAALTGQPARSRRFIKVYLSIWALLASGALVYLAVLAFPSQTAAPVPQAHLETPREVSRNSSTEMEVQAIRGDISEIRKDVSQLQEAVGERVINEKVVQTRLSALEERVATIDPPHGSDPPPPDNVNAAPQRPGETSSRPAPQPAEAAPVAAAPVTPPIETGSIAPKPKEAAPKATEEIVFGAPLVTRADKPELAVQLAAGPSVQALKQSWGELSERHAEALSALQPRVVPPRGKGRNYRLIAGPVATEAEAARICSALGAGPQACFVTAYAGAPL